MSAKVVLFVVGSFLLAGLTAGTAAAQDFQKSYPLPAGGSIRIANISGDVTVTGYDGTTVNVTGTIEGSTPDVIQIVDRSSANTVDVGVHYPNNCHNCDASVQFQVQVPRSVSYEFDRLRSISGDVTVSNVTGRVDASTVSGSVRMTGITGGANGKSVSGDVEADLADSLGTDDMHFTTVSGSVTVTLPSSASANVEMSSFSGGLSTDFPLQIQKEQFTSHQSASGQIGAGGRRVHMSSVSGSISLKQR